MKIFYRIGLIILFAVWFMGLSHAQNVTNIAAKQVGYKIYVSYDLDVAADISLHLSVDSGKTFRELYEVSGDVGETVGPGHKTIVWDVLEEMSDFFVENGVVFKVKVDANAERAWRAIQRQEQMSQRQEQISQQKEQKAVEKAQEKELKEREKALAREEKAKEKADKKEGRMDGSSMPYSTFLTLNTAFSPQPQWSCGFKVGGVKVVGWFVSLMTGFHFNGMYHPFEEGQIYALNGNNKSIRFSAQAGVVMRFCKPVSMMIGVGYGYRTFACQTTNNTWYAYPVRTIQGVDASIGLLFDIKGFALSAEAVTTNFKTIEARVGIGFCLPHHSKKQE